MNIPIRLIFGLTLMIGANALANDDFTSLEEQMTLEEFKAAGLEKLTADELKRLNDWLRRNDVAPEPAAAPSDNRVAQGFRPVMPERQTIESRIDGDFEGWSGRTVFKLENGQVWRQTDGKTFRYNATNPSVRIEPKALGVWKMYVADLNRGVKVTRIK